MTLLRNLALGALLIGAAACTTPQDGRVANPSGNPPGTAATRALDQAAGTNVSGAYPMQSDGMPGNPPGTAAGRAVNRATR